MEDLVIALVGQIHYIHPIEWGVILTNIAAVVYKTWLYLKMKKEQTELIKEVRERLPEREIRC